MKRVLQGRIAGRVGLFELQMTGHVIDEVTSLGPVPPGPCGDWLSPGLFDLQVNGYLGHSFGDPDLSSRGAAAIDEGLSARGVTAYLPTIITSSPESTADAVVRLASMGRHTLKGFRGIHLEGPWISPRDGYRGVHQARFVRPPSPRELERLHQLSEGTVTLLTLAPELDGALELIEAAVALGITVSLGHTAAGYDVIDRAVAAGATLSTHLFNGCVQQVDRHENPILAQLAHDGLAACFIADGHHVPWPALKVGLRAKGHRSLLVSDLAPLGGLPEGTYEMEGNPVVLADGGLRVPGSSLLSGAARALDEDLALLAAQIEPGWEEALLMASVRPAQALGQRAWAELKPGRVGPVVHFHWDGKALTSTTL